MSGEGEARGGPGPRRPWSIEPMCEQDLDAVLRIETASHPTPWPRALFISELALDWAALEVLRDADRRLLGYVDYWFVHDELHILNVAVEGEARRQGCARRLLEHVLEVAVAHAVVYVTLEVRANNHGAQRLYEAFHFEVVGRRKGYYSDTGEDALIMARILEAPGGG